MSRKIRARLAARPPLLGDRDHTRRVARRASLAVFAVTLTILSPLAYGLTRARNVQSDQLAMMDAVLVGIAVLAAALAIAFAANVTVHLLGREARARRDR